MEWIETNKEWVFSGIGVLIISIIIGIIRFYMKDKKENTIQQTQTLDNKSKGIQVGGNINMNSNERNFQKPNKGK